MDEIRLLLAQPLREDSLNDQLTQAESKAAEACASYRAAEEKLADLRGRMYDPSGKTELERRIALDRVCREQQREVDDWKDIVALIAQRIQLGMALIKEQ